MHLKYLQLLFSIKLHLHGWINSFSSVAQQLRFKAAQVKKVYEAQEDR